MKDTMLSRLLGRLGAPEAVGNEAVAALQAEFDNFKVAAEAEKQELAAALETALAAVADADKRVAELSGLVESLQGAAEKMKADAEATAAAARLEKITSIVGATKAQAVADSTKGLSDEQLSVVLNAMAAAATAEAQSKMFTEQGAAAQADVAAHVAGESEEMRILREKYAGK